MARERTSPRGTVLPRPRRTSEDTQDRWTSANSQRTEDKISQRTEDKIGGISAHYAPMPACRHANLASDSYQGIVRRVACLALQLLGMRDTALRSKDPAILNNKGMHLERMAIRNFARPAAQVNEWRSHGRYGACVDHVRLLRSVGGVGRTP